MASRLSSSCTQKRFTSADSSVHGASKTQGARRLYHFSHTAAYDRVDCTELSVHKLSIKVCSCKWSTHLDNLLVDPVHAFPRDQPHHLQHNCHDFLFLSAARPRDPSLFVKCASDAECRPNQTPVPHRQPPTSDIVHQIASMVSCTQKLSNFRTRSHHSVCAEICSAAKFRVSQATARTDE